MPGVPGYDLDHFANDQPKLVPAPWYALSAAAACGAVARVTTTLAGTFVAPGSASATELWDITHASSATPPEVKAFGTGTMPERIREFGAITLVVSVLRARDSIRVREVMAVGTGSDYRLEDLQGSDAGVLEVSGISGPRTSGIASRKRKQVSAASAFVRRIGVVAFGGPQFLIERLP